MALVQAIIYGLGAGLLISILLGAIFFLLIQKSLQLGWKSSYSIAAGVVSIDALYVFFTIVFTSQISVFLQNNASAISLAGGIVLLVFGLYQLFIFNPKSTHNYKKGSLYITAATINLLNPANAAWWLGLYAIEPASNYALNQKIAFGFAALVAIFITEVLIAYFAKHLKSWLSPKRLSQLYKTVGFVFVLFGIKLLFF